jgi:hypothetical protein
MANGLGARQVRVSQGAGNDALAHAVRDMLGGSDA